MFLSAEVTLQNQLELYIMKLIMPLRQKEDKNSKNHSIDYKARLERKLCLARENPEPIFDLSHCSLKNVPSNIFSLVKVFRKRALYLQNNILSTLSSGGPLEDLQNVTIIDISENKFTRLPSNINVLKCLEVFDISKNQLQNLPPGIGELRNLKWLNASNNNLKYLPDTIGNCVNLELLNVSFNELLKTLPSTLGRLHSLKVLHLDETVTYPPRDVCQQGTKAILKFFLQELGGNDTFPSTSKEVQNVIENTAYNSLQDQIRQHEELKQKQQNERLAVERQILDDNQRELEIQQQLKNQKNKLLEGMKNEQEELNAALTKLQQKKDVDRALLLKLCTEEEKKSSDTITKILNHSKNLRAQVVDSWEKERKQEEELLFSRTTMTKALERKHILESMDEMMREEIEKVQTISADRRYKCVQSLASEISSQDKALEKIMKKYGENHSHLIEAINRDEELQKSAVASLLEKSDSVSWELSRQILIIETQLAELTRLEMSKKNLQRNCQIMELNKNRIALTEVLMDLFLRQDERRRHLVETIRRMEMMRESDKNSETFWMEQYDKLLTSKSHQMVKFLEAVNPKLVQQLFVHGVFHYLPLLKAVALSPKKLESIDMNTLSQLGIKDAEDRRNIMLAVESYLTNKGSSHQPSAPIEEEPSAPVLNNSNAVDVNTLAYIVPEECVICLEMKPSVIFVPCGHVCCCYKCFKSVVSCPLCRKRIDEAREITESLVNKS